MRPKRGPVCAGPGGRVLPTTARGSWALRASSGPETGWGTATWRQPALRHVPATDSSGLSRRAAPAGTDPGAPTPNRVSTALRPHRSSPGSLRAPGPASTPAAPSDPEAQGPCTHPSRDTHPKTPGPHTGISGAKEMRKQTSVWLNGQHFTVLQDNCIYSLVAHLIKN